MRRILLILFAAVAVPSLAIAQPKPAPVAKTGSGTAAVKQATDTVAALLKQKVAPGSKEEKELAGKITASVRGFIDIELLGKRAMVDQWAKLSKDQQQQFVTLLRELIEDNHIKNLRANAQYSVDYLGETTDKDGNIVVTTKINTERKGRPYSIEVVYILAKDGDKLRAFDVKTDGVGLVENYRTQFNKVIAKDGFDGLIAKMKKKQTAAGGS